jgi:hypothetical protein
MIGLAWRGRDRVTRERLSRARPGGMALKDENHAAPNVTVRGISETTRN